MVSADSITGSPNSLPEFRLSLKNFIVSSGLSVGFGKRCDVGIGDLRPGDTAVDAEGTGQEGWSPRCLCPGKNAGGCRLPGDSAYQFVVECGDSCRS